MNLIGKTCRAVMVFQATLCASPEHLLPQNVTGLGMVVSAGAYSSQGWAGNGCLSRGVQQSGLGWEWLSQ